MPDNTMDEVTDPAEFDLDAWLGGVKPTGKGFTIYQDGELYDQYQDACDRYDALLEGDDTSDGDAPDEVPLGAKSELAQLGEQITRMEAKLRPGALVGRVRSANFDDQAQARRKSKVKDDDGADAIDPNEFYLHMVSSVALSPKLTVPEWRKVALAVGERQWQVVRDAIEESLVESKGYDLDFSSRRSARR